MTHFTILKKIDAFLNLDIPGTKVVCGVGPLEASLKQRYPQVRWMGVLPRQELTRVYSAADVFVFPSRSETFGLVMLEAMATGTPVAAYPVDGRWRCCARLVEQMMACITVVFCTLT